MVTLTTEEKEFLQDNLGLFETNDVGTAINKLYKEYRSTSHSFTYFRRILSFLADGTDLLDHIDDTCVKDYNVLTISNANIATINNDKMEALGLYIDLPTITSAAFENATIPMTDVIFSHKCKRLKEIRLPNLKTCKEGFTLIDLNNIDEYNDFLKIYLPQNIAKTVLTNAGAYGAAQHSWMKNAIVVV